MCRRNPRQVRQEPKWGRSITGTSLSFCGLCRAIAENFGEFLWRHHFELIIRTVAWTFIETPPPKLRRMTEATPLHVVICDFDYKFGTQRFPGQILPLTPAT